jgi:hypothetical protein
MSREALKGSFRKCGAEYVEVLGPLVITSWKSPALAAKCADTMRRAGLRSVKTYPNGDETALTVEGGRSNGDRLHAQSGVPRRYG